ncbi:MAG: hypothetical protein IT338_18130 [Thermomicrobiales bacterium]|nr:hypothetical protein [Thermomicrobiales bacterium]
MTLLRNLLDRVGSGSNARFNRYYGDVVRSGAGYPTADEARRDMQQLDRVVNRYGWVR